MYALVQFLVDKVKAIVPVKDIKNFDPVALEIDFSRAYEVFWKSPQGEGTGFWYAVVLLVEDTVELIEQRKKRVRFPPPQRLEELLALTINSNDVQNEEDKHKSKAIEEKRAACEKEKLRAILKSKLSKGKKIRKRSPSRDESSSEDDLVLKSDLRLQKIEHQRVLNKLKLKEEENILLKKQNSELQELNVRLQKQLLSTLSAREKTSLSTAPDSDKGSASVVRPSSAVMLKERKTSLSTAPNCDKGDASIAGPSRAVMPLERQTSFSTAPDSDKGNASVAKPRTAITPKETQTSLPNSSIPDEADASSAVPSSGIIPEESNSSRGRDLYLHNDGNLMLWNNEQMELAPGIFVTREKWEKVISGKNMNLSRVTRNLAVSLWGSDTLLERSVTGSACRRFKKDGVEAKQALTPIKVDAVQNGLRYWILNHLNKEEQEAVKLSSPSAIRKMLSDKIMDLTKQKKKNLTQ